MAQSEAAIIMLDETDEARVLLDPNGTIRDWSTAAESLLGWTAEEAVGRNMMELTVPPALHSELRANHINHLVFSDGTLHDRRFQVDKLDHLGRRFPADVNVHVVRLGDEVLLRATIRDLSSGAAQRRLAAAVGGRDDAAFAADGRRTITEWNMAAERLFGHSRPAAVGLPADLIVAPELRAQSRALWRRAAASGEVRLRTRRIDRRGASIDVELTITRAPEDDDVLVASHRPL